MHIVLASASPRRALLLQMLGLDFTTAEPAVNEAPQPDEAAPDLVIRLACAKAEAVQPDFPDALLIAADTVVACDGAILGKPKDNAEALAMLRTLSGRQHQVFTGLAMRWRQEVFTHVACSSVTMPEHPDALLRAYLASGESVGKAGAYGIQGRGGVLVSAITGDFYNVVGLPLQALWQGFCALGCSSEFLQALGS
ncbi:MAG: Maf family protein [Cardiobacteriaceae bacterium]|nr:Maf family protein [Cardiobacteriaceae bacterium]